jgi:hypothetical protein
MKKYKVITHLNGKAHEPVIVGADQMSASKDLTVLMDSQGDLIASFPGSTLLSCVELKAISSDPSNPRINLNVLNQPASVESSPWLHPDPSEPGPGELR